MLRKTFLLGMFAASVFSAASGCTKAGNSVEFPDDPVEMPVEDDESSDEQQQESEG
ncbi:MAG: hypothetical protein Aurels2KO_34110 [Aureliella sp.]